jgi:predicted NBD/HSP70 family sugar kinase
MKKVLVVDIGGTHVKLMISRGQKRKFNSGMKLSPRQLVAEIKKTAADWKFDAVSIGFPAPVHRGEITKDPKHLAKGWVGWDFRKSLDKPVRVINDAAMQALGSYHGGRMLFLGLGTGLGSALLWEKNVLPLELGDLPYGNGEMIEEYVSKRGLERMGRKLWLREVHHAVTRLKLSLIADYVVLGGGNAKLLTKLPEGCELGANKNAYLGGVRLWQKDTLGRDKWKIIS